MARKKKRDNFNQIPRPISKQKPGNLLSQGRVRNLPSLPGDACTTEISENTNLDIIRSKGRTGGSQIVYSPENTYNYLSQSQRWDRSILLIPAYITEEENRVIYGFCSHGSPKGFWEVVVGQGGTATYINLSPNFITILCPRPFFLDELITIDSDSSVYTHTQIAGNRTVLIEPNNLQYPLYDIQSTCYTGTCDSNSISPLIIRIETDNPLVFADLVILNRPIDNLDGLGYVGVVETDIDDQKVKTFYRVPDDLQRVYLWLGTPLLITWLNPILDSEFIYQFRVQINTPPYTDNQNISISDPRIATLNANQRYRVATDFNVFGNQFTSFSDPVFFNYPNPDNLILFADDSGIGLSYAYISNAYDTVEFGNQIINETDPSDLSLGYVYISNAYDTIEFGVEVIDEIDSNDIAVGYTFINNTYEKVDLGGVEIG